MAMKDILGRFKKGPEEEFIPEEEFVPEEAPVDEKPSFVFTDINSEPIDAAEPVPEAPVHSGPVKVGSSDNDRIQMFEIDLGGSHVKLPEEPVVEAPAVEEPVYETYAPAPEPVYTPAPEPEVEDTIVVAPTPEAAGAEDDYEVDFGYSAPGALDDVTYTTDPAAVPKPAEPEPVVYTRSEAPAADDEEYYDSYEPMFEESYGPGSYFAGGETAAAAAVAPAAEDYVPYEAPAAEALEAAEPVEVEAPPEVQTYDDDMPRYENYRKPRNKTRYRDEPRSYENNIDDSVFLPDEGDTPVFSKKNRRRMTIAIIAILAALLLVLGGVLISHFTGRSDKAAEATTAQVKTTAFERSVSNNASATTTTTEEDISAQYDENGEISESTASTSYSSTSRRTSTRTTTRSTTASTTRSTTRSTTASTTQSTTAPTTEPTTETPPTTQSTSRSTTAAPSPWDHVNN
ncbi:MAG: hypothetical protein IJ051_04555 [Clostridia bacterium]|nr:hypothetical protein [Clostridia bacterium]